MGVFHLSRFAHPLSRCTLADWLGAPDWAHKMGENISGTKSMALEISKRVDIFLKKSPAAPFRSFRTIQPSLPAHHATGNSQLLIDSFPVKSWKTGLKRISSTRN